MLKEREIIRLLHQGISQCEYFTHFSEILTNMILFVVRKIILMIHLKNKL